MVLDSAAIILLSEDPRGPILPILHYIFNPCLLGFLMPTLQIMSIHRERKRAFASELAQVRTEREQFTTTLVARFGKETADAMRREAWRREEIAPRRGEMPKLSQEISLAAKTLQTLDRTVMTVRKKIRTPDCWFRELPGPVSVLEEVGLSWRMVHEKCSNGRLPISGRIVAAESSPCGQAHHAPGARVGTNGSGTRSVPPVGKVATTAAPQASPAGDPPLHGGNAGGRRTVAVPFVTAKRKRVRNKDPWRSDAVTRVRN